MRQRVLFIPFLLTALLLMAAPILHSGKPPLAQTTLNLCGAFLLFSLAWSDFRGIRIYRFYWLFIIFSIFSVAVYLLPVPLYIWTSLPGRELYVGVFEWIGTNDDINPDTRLSIVPYRTWHSLLAMLPLVAVFLSTITMPVKYVKRLLQLFLVVAFFQAALGTLQFLSVVPGTVFGISLNNGTGMGTYPNPNHFSALLEMALPVAFAMLLINIKRSGVAGEIHRMDLLKSSINYSLLIGGALLIVFVAILFSRSRAGALLAILAIALSIIIFSRQAARIWSIRSTIVISIAAVFSGLMLGAIPVLNRFMALNPMEDDRWIVFNSAWYGIRSFFPLGSGPGTFPDIYRAFQPVEKLFFVNHVHNDYLEILFEMGILGIMVILGFIAFYISGWYRLMKQDWGNFHYIQVASGISLFILLLHSLVDFNLHTPANAIVFAFLAGIFFRKRQDLQRHQKTGTHRSA